MATVVPLPAPHGPVLARRPRRRRRGDNGLEDAVGRVRPAVVAVAVACAAAEVGGAGGVAHRVLLLATAYVAAALAWERVPVGLRRRGAPVAALADAGALLALLAVSGGGASPLAALAPVVGLGVGLRFRPATATALGALLAAGLAWTVAATTPALVLAWTTATVVAVPTGLALSARWAGQQRRLRAAEREAQRRARDQDEALRRLCHELRTPVASLSALVSAVRGSSAMSEDARRRALDLVERHADHLSGLLEEVRVFTETARRPPAPRSTCDVWLPGVIDAAAAAAGLGDGEVDVRLDASAALVRIDAVKVRQVLTNLLENARRHGSTTVPIVVVASADHSTLRLAVANAAREGAASEERGSGLGLSIVAGLVEAMGGRVSRQPWHGGSRVAVRVPVDAARPGHSLARGTA